MVQISSRRSVLLRIPVKPADYPLMFPNPTLQGDRELERLSTSSSVTTTPLSPPSATVAITAAGDGGVEQGTGFGDRDFFIDSDYFDADDLEMIGLFAADDIDNDSDERDDKSGHGKSLSTSSSVTTTPISTPSAMAAVVTVGRGGAEQGAGSVDDDFVIGSDFFDTHDLEVLGLLAADDIAKDNDARNDASADDTIGDDKSCDNGEEKA